ncbi:pilus assembly PilX family protein [Halopseudomonas yangmingensis]|uniref:Type IV pilus assembly protein PilX n=1 Tax=Halopseudomonas yangmingensis TaxID=1720063 RepID=A0A1I4NZT2_9GAMM|nr:PilX N-terminal domain-containing pilus assembly protein [Halopseudomonas yangmingensis]SFM21028.1 type IV pilus assembly protein PilX [Halopseudomonas yangmingensis]
MKNNLSIIRQQASHKKQRGAALLLGLVFLVILTGLAVTSMREVALDARITGNLIGQKDRFHAAEAGLRDGEYRIAGKLAVEAPGQYPIIPLTRYSDKVAAISRPDAKKECPASLKFDDVCVIDKNPIFAQDFTEAKSYSPDNSNTSFTEIIEWYAIPYFGGASDAASEVPEYGAAAASIGPVRHEINARASDGTNEVRLRSTVVRIYY